MGHVDELSFRSLPVVPGWMSVHVQSVGSTNVELAQIFVRDGKALDRHWLTAGEQTIGRGRRSREWVSPPGNLYASLCLDITGLPDQKLSVMPLAIGVAIHRCVSQLIAADVRLKWPNDVLIDGGKCCGILLERHVHAVSGDVGLIAGMGLNIASHPSNTPYPATNLGLHGFNGTLSTVFNTLSAVIADTVADLQSAGFVTRIQKEWLSRAKGIGEPVTVNLANETLQGIFERLDDEGRLQLRLGDGTLRTITAGDVFFS